MNDPDIIDQLLQHVRDQCPGLVTVDEAWFAEPIDHFDAQTPATLIYLAEDGAESGIRKLQPAQQITLSYGIWLVGDRQLFKPQRLAIKDALLGWVPSEQYSAMAYSKGKTEDIRGSLIWWREFWEVQTTLRGPRRTNL